MQTIDLQPDIIYGPVHSRRLGRSLGVNLLPTDSKVCSFNCCYCQYGWTDKLVRPGDERVDGFPSAEAVRAALLGAFRERQFDFVTFSGNGEPTLHPRFREIVEFTLQLRNRERPKARVAVLTNGTTARQRDVKEALQQVDVPVMKLDAGNERMFRKMNHGVAGITLEEIMHGILAVGRCAVQSMFVRGRVNNSTGGEVVTWVERLTEIRPLWVQVYTLDRGAADPEVEPVPAWRLQEIAEFARAQTGIPVEVY